MSPEISHHRDYATISRNLHENILVNGVFFPELFNRVHVTQRYLIYKSFTATIFERSLKTEKVIQFIIAGVSLMKHYADTNREHFLDASKECN